jgi:hypothetical protein
MTAGFFSETMVSDFVLAHPIKAREIAMEIINNFNLLLLFKKYY